MHLPSRKGNTTLRSTSLPTTFLKMASTPQCHVRRSPRLWRISPTPTIRKTGATNAKSLTIASSSAAGVSDQILSPPPYGMYD
ncbi:unnamed protein product [Chondrus crispus]|uniref:Uncharacterized protein n=1 Tax=Chondrus crispus TaxID=2769 RepID=R7QKJ4_CHOCR|nr:unnamed protein product [Chondrus crispus]CDF37925.1 unnamed protein product [Chondrus crispus]|eukprot:XP_005717796.1 unnamed protein product [Chondrus crispus]